MRFRELGAEGPYPKWLRELRGKSGAYVIAAPHWFYTDEPGAILYVGESHTGRLYQTCSRHFQQWKGRGAGPTYSRAGVLVGIEVTEATDAITTEARLICELEPRDNERGCWDAELEGVPF